MRRLSFAALSLLLLSFGAPAAGASEIALAPFPMPDLFDQPPPPGGPVRRYLTSYVKTYPFGSLREDYTPLGKIGESKAVYYGRPRHFATLHVVRHRRHPARHLASRTALRARY
jgi:hypothetical protein